MKGIVLGLDLQMGVEGPGLRLARRNRQPLLDRPVRLNLGFPCIQAALVDPQGPPDASSFHISYKVKATFLPRKNHPRHPLRSK